MIDTSILGMEVALGDIDREFKKLWEADQATTKASLMNFAVYSEAANALLDNTPLIREITREHACRAILIGAGLDRPDSGARAWITAHCNLSGDHKAVCSEQIAFQLDGKAIGRIRNIVFAHMESDLPLVLWWQGGFSRIFEPNFYQIIDRLIVDSDAWEEPAREFAVLREALTVISRPMVVHDLSWTRSFQIRATFAAMFDEQASLHELGFLKNVRIRHSPVHRISALLIAAWLAERLGWKLQNREMPNQYEFVHNKGPVQLRLEESNAEDAPVSLVELVSANGRYLLSREPGALYLHCSSTTGSHTWDQLTPADCDSQAGLVTSQLARAGNNQLLRRVLPMLGELM